MADHVWSAEEIVAPSQLVSVRSYYPAMPWRAKCYECGEEAGITRPRFETVSSLVVGDLQAATAFYETHPRSPTDTRSCSGAGKVIPKYQMREAYSTTPGEDPPDLDPRGIRR